MFLHYHMAHFQLLRLALPLFIMVIGLIVHGLQYALINTSNGSYFMYRIVINWLCIHEYHLD